MFDNPVIERTVVFIFKRTERMGYSLKSILDRMGEIVHREDTPFCSLAVVVDIADTVEYRVAHIEVTGSEIDFRS